MASGRRAKQRRERATPLPAPLSDPPPRRPRRWKALAAGVLAVTALGAAGFFLRGPVERYRTDRRFARAQQLLAGGQDLAAATELEAALARDPAHRAARLALAAVELRRNRVEHAFLQLDAYTELAPEDAEGWMRLGDLRSRAGQVEEAEAALTQALEIEPGRVDARRTRAALRQRMARFNGALVDAEAAVARDARDVPSWLVLCDAIGRVRGAGARAEAVRNAIAAAGPDPQLLALSRNPPPVAAHSGPERPPQRPGQAENWPGQLGATVRDFAAELRRKSFGTASAVARSAGKTWPGTMVGPWLEGVAAQSEGNVGVARQRYLAALAVSPHSHRAITNLVAVWSRQGGAEVAGDQLVQLVDEDPGLAYPLPIAAHAYVEAARPAKGEATIRRMFAVLPSSPVPYREVAK